MEHRSIIARVVRGRMLNQAMDGPRTGVILATVRNNRERCSAGGSGWSEAVRSGDKESKGPRKRSSSVANEEKISGSSSRLGDGILIPCSSIMLSLFRIKQSWQGLGSSW